MKRIRVMSAVAAFVVLVGMFAFAIPMGSVLAKDTVIKPDITLVLMPPSEILNANNGPALIWADVKFNIPQGTKTYIVYLMGQSETEGVPYTQTFKKEMKFNGRFSARFDLRNRAIAKNGYKFSVWAEEKNGLANIPRKEVKMFTDFASVTVKNIFSWRIDDNHFKASFTVENIRDMCAFYGEGVLIEVEVRVKCASIYSYFPTKEVEIISPYDGKVVVDHRVYCPKVDGPVCVNMPIHSNDKNDDHWWRITIYDPTGRRIVYQEGDGYSMHKANLDKYVPTP